MLKTIDLATAKMRAGLLSNALDALLRRFETMSEISTETINTHIRSYFQAALNRSLEHALLLPTDPCVDLDAEIATLRTQVRELQKRLARQIFTTQVLDTGQTIADAGPDLRAKAEMQGIALLCNGVLRADLEKARILSNQLEGRHDQLTPLDPLFTGMAANGLPQLPRVRINGRYQQPAMIDALVSGLPMVLAQMKLRGGDTAQGAAPLSVLR